MDNYDDIEARSEIIKVEVHESSNTDIFTGGPGQGEDYQEPGIDG